MDTGVVGALVVLALEVVIIGMILLGRLPREIKTLLAVGLVLRIVGSQAYYYVSEWIYGFGDYSNYYDIGLRWGDAFLAGTTDSLRSPYLREWFGTGFTVRLAGLLLIVLGPSINGAFLTFALVGFGGIVALAVAFARAFPEAPLERYLAWIVFFPSLWYWPAALGKDALVLAGIGLGVLGYVGRRGRTGWLPLISGLSLVFVIRPQVAVVVVVSMFAAYWLETDSRWTARRIVQGVALLVGGVLLTFLASGALGISLFNAGEIDSYLDARVSTTAYGGSAVSTGGGVTGMVMGLVNVLFRPFPWEAGSVASAIAAVEVFALWGLAFWKRKDIKSFFLANRRSRLLWFSIVFMAVYSLLTGMALGNLGLIARQRIHIFPFLLMFFAGSRRAPQAARRPVLPARRYSFESAPAAPAPARLREQVWGRAH